jgi:CBS domain containing-hemolysin-like protein
MAFAKVNKTKLSREADKKVKAAILANSFVNDYNDTITIILIGNNIVNIAASSLATILFTSISPNNGEWLATLVMTLTVLTFGEIIPKSLATSYSYGFSKLFAYPMKFFQLLFYPLTWLIKKTTNGLNSLLSKKSTENEIDEDELIEMVDTLEEQGLIDEDTQELITNAIDFIDIDAVEIMVHRTDVFAYDINDDITELLNNPRLLNYSRIPVYEESIDNIVGILNTKQLIKLHLNGDKIVLNDIITEPLYVFPTQSVSDVLRLLRKKHIHMAIIKDEYGGTKGLLTMEDILEELVGEIYDEKDEKEMDEYHKVNENKFTVDGDMNIYDFFDLIDYDYGEDYESIYTTVGGWITDELEKFPEETDTFDFEGHRITVIRAGKFTAERVSVLRLNDEEGEE